MADPSLSEFEKCVLGGPFRRLYDAPFMYGSHLAPPSPKRFARFFPFQRPFCVFGHVQRATAAEIPDMEGEIFAECGEIFPLSLPTVARPLAAGGEEGSTVGGKADRWRDRGDRPDIRIRRKPT